jgi:hypothetical protein
MNLLDRGFEQILFDAIERGALIDEIALLEQDSLQVTFDSRPDFDAVDRFDPPDELARLRNGTLFSNNRADSDGSGGF